MAGRKIIIEFLGKDSTDKTTRAVEQRFGRLGKNLDRVGQTAGKVLAGGFALGGIAAVRLGQKASDLAETQSKVAQIFGQESTAALDQFASGAAKAMGQSKQTALDGAATFGIIGKSAGLAGEDLVGFSTDMVKLAGDMASFNNTSPEEAIEAIGAGMRGEAEPLRKFGVLLDDATLRAEAMRMGLIKTTKQALTPQQKALAAQGVIMKQTKDQQGDFARTSGGLANKQRILRAQLENMGTALGAKVLPVMVKASAIGLKMANWVSRNSTLVGVLVAVVGTMAAGLWAASVAMRAVATATQAWAAIQKIVTAGQWLMNAALSANPIGLIVVGIAALVAGLVIAYKKSETFRAIVDGAFRAVQRAASFAFNWVKRNWPLLLAIITGPIGLAVLAVVKNWSKIKAGAGNAVAYMKDRFNSFVSFARSIPGKLGRAFSGAFNGLRNAFRSAINFIIRGWNSLQFRIPGFDPPGPGPKFGGMTIGVPKIPQLATGAVVKKRPGGILANIGEGRYDEGVFPLDKNGMPRGMAAAARGDDRPILVQVMLDGKVLLESLVRQKRLLGRPLGLA